MSEEGWETRITKVQPDNLIISGYPLQSLVEGRSLLEVACLLVTGELPDRATVARLEALALEAAALPAPPVRKLPKDDISKTLAACLLTDEGLAMFPNEKPEEKTAYALGRTARYLASIYGTESALAASEDSLSSVIFKAFTGQVAVDPRKARLLEAMITACVDHGVTPPSAQATLIAASTRAAYEVAVAHGVGAITDVHGGAGAKAARFFDECIADYSGDLAAIIKDYGEKKKRIAGLGHRVHRNDPRRDILWKLASEAGVAGKRTELSMAVSQAFKETLGKDLPINVDGVIGAIVADIGLDKSAAKSIFILGRVAGLSAHYFEELATQPKMRNIVFGEARYAGKPERPVPGVSDD